MIALLWALLRGADFARRVVKLSLTLVAADMIGLVVLSACIAAKNKILFDPQLALFGSIYMATTALTIWLFGGRELDVSTVLGLLEEGEKPSGLIDKAWEEGKKLGRAVLTALKVFFLFEATIVTFGFFVPVWGFWPGYFILFVLLIGMLISGNLAKGKWPWNAFWKVYITLIVAMIGLMYFVAGYEFITGQKVAVASSQMGWLKTQFWLVMAGVLFLFGIIPKIPAHGLWRFLGVTCAIIWIATLYFGDPLKKDGAGDNERRTKVTKAATVARARVAPAETVVQTVTVDIPTGAPVVHTGLYMKEGQRARFYQSAPRLYHLRGIQHNVSVQSTYWEDKWISPGEIQFVGGPEPTTVTIKVLKVLG